MLIELLLLSTIFISMLVGCKKKNEASKLKPRNLDKNSAAGTPNTGGVPPSRKTSAESSAFKKEELPPPPQEKEEKLLDRPADDNETINDAKSNWGTVT